MAERDERRDAPVTPTGQLYAALRDLVRYEMPTQIEGEAAKRWNAADNALASAESRPAAPERDAVQEAMYVYQMFNPSIGLTVNRDAMTAALRTYSARLRETAQRVAIDKEYAPATRDQLCQNG
jgi:hypothetical protein